MNAEKLKKIQHKGDKKNSSFFEEFLPQIYDRRQSSGLNDLLGQMRTVMVQVQTGDTLNYIAELYLMTPYRFHAGYINATHKLHILRINEHLPDYIVLEPLVGSYRDRFSALNNVYPKSEVKPNAKYLGEIYHTRNLAETQKILESQQFRFLNISSINNNFLCHPSFIRLRRRPRVYPRMNAEDCYGGFHPGSLGG